MKLFRCPCCDHTVFFENQDCESCGAALAYDPQQNVMLAAAEVSCCANRQFGVCNWALGSENNADNSPEFSTENTSEECSENSPENGNSDLCQSCQLNRYIPDTSQPELLESWGKLEVAKRRLIYSLNRLELPVISKVDDASSGLSFDFISPDQPLPPDAVATTGHASGRITINLDEADPVEREKAKESMEERYRTLLGHMRHEVGHYFWEVLVLPSETELDAFRQRFGDEQADYGASLETHYNQGAPADWKDRFVSAYASSHPWEDWAESWAHYLHLCDTLETAFHYGLSIQPVDANDSLHGSAAFDPYRCADFEEVVEGCLPVIYAANSLNRSMGQNDLYPFVLVPAVIEKMAFIHRLLWKQRFEAPAPVSQSPQPQQPEPQPSVSQQPELQAPPEASQTGTINE
ncbi:zinc-binding metallopeptidase family protein [Oceanobacter kriegii]|uniref:zinc-binding metallopeptidase family protein n=1 Tax=Oceanobacter kriegii TaxID=64972 RepID=UPI00041F254C|nr:putative zinc-binding metallopeptidase [Oceanobacter kriegii]